MIIIIMSKSSVYKVDLNGRNNWKIASVRGHKAIWVFALRLSYTYLQPFIENSPYLHTDDG